MSDQNIVNVSGGKDSTALLLLALERGTENLRAVFADTGNEHPLTYDYVQYLHANVFPIQIVKADFAETIRRKREKINVVWRAAGVSEELIERALAVLHPTGVPFLDLCMARGRFPSATTRFCTEDLKINPVNRQVVFPLMDAGEDVVCWQGVRADESASRALLPERELKRMRGDAEMWNYRPILSWNVADVFEMHRKHGVEPNPLYKMGMGRVGCMPCIHARKDEVLEIARRFPAEFERIAEWERLVTEANPRYVSSFFAVKTAEEAKTGGIWQVVEWAKTGRGGKQYDIFRSQDDGPLCSSIYGLCE